MSILCAYCGESNQKKSLVNRFCINCGEELNEMMNQEPVQLAPPITNTPYLSSNYSADIPVRSPLLWVIASIFVPFFIYFYAYYNFQDMKDLNEKYHKSEESTQDPAMMLFLFIIFPLLTIYYKFEQFYTHLRRTHQETPSIPDGPGIILNTIGGILVIFFIFLAVIYFDILHVFLASAIVTLAFGIHLSYYHYRWQKEFNFHIIRHMQA